VSPAPYADRLATVVGHGWYGEMETCTLARSLERSIEAMLYAAPGEPERMAIHRAVLTVVIVAMQQADDGFGELAEVFREHERAYLAMLRDRAGEPGLLRDLLELATWEDYGLSEGVPDFLRALPEAHADVAVREFARIIPELRREELRYQLGRARELRRALVGAFDGAQDDEARER
jgi:pimeloyl-ACP methyl ester carboxylesterase